MASTSVLAVLVTVLVSSASSQCPEGNCTEPQQLPIVRMQISSLFPFPFFGLTGDSEEQSNFDEAIDPLQSTINSSEPMVPQEVLSFHFMEIVSVNDDDKSEAQSDYESPDFTALFRQSRPGVLDLSGLSLTGEDLANHLKKRQVINMPVTSLILSNARVHGLTASSFQPVEETLEVLRMDNCSVNLDALINLSNLLRLNLSNSGLSTFQWYPKLRDTLQVLDLSHNQFVEVRPELSILTSLKELDLSHNRITSVSEFPLVLLPNLEKLSLTMNSISKATFTGLDKLEQLAVDWNYLWRCGYELRLPSQRLSVKIASNPWRCDCGLLEVRDNYDVLDIDKLQCANRQSFAVCDDCQRYYLPMEDGLVVSNLTKSSIEHLGCTGFTDQLYLLRGALVNLKEYEPEKLFGLVMLFSGCLILLVTAVVLCRRQSVSNKKFNRQSWLKVQQIPYLKIDKLTKPQEVPYIKI